MELVKFTLRSYQNEDDYWAIRAFLREVYMQNHRHELGWQASRFDYWRWHMVENVRIVDALEKAVFLWETETEQLAAVLNADNQNEAILSIHPDFHSSDLEEEMIDVAEKNFGLPGQPFFTFVHDLAPSRQAILRRRGYSEGDGLREHQWRRDLTTALPDVLIPAGFSVRSIGEIGGGDWPSRSWASWRAFHPNEPDAAYEGWEWSLNWVRSPLYRRDLDIVAVAPDGQVAAYCVLWYDDVTRTGLFDPVAVMPEYQRRGLGRAIMVEAMRRAKHMGATLATVSGYDQGANALYCSILSPMYDLNVPWVKTLAFS
jgi:GNAT superfamily N-acetyltransferase